MINVDVLGQDSGARLATNMLNRRLSVISEIADTVDAHSFIATPVFETYSEDAPILGFYTVSVPWERYFENLLPEGKNGFEVVLNDSCGTVLTYSVNGPESKLKGEGDLHDSDYDYLGKGWVYVDSFRDMVPIDKYNPKDTPENECVYQLYVYPTDVLRDYHVSKDPIIYALYVSLIFVFTALIFLAYDWAVARRQDKVLRTATRTQAIVASLFPENVQERILQEADGGKDNQTFTPRFRTNRTKDQLRSFLNDAEDDPAGNSAAKLSLKSRPIADLFPEATVIFAE